MHTVGGRRGLGLLTKARDYRMAGWKTKTTAAAQPLGGKRGPDFRWKGSDEEAAVSQEILEDFFIHWDDSHFRDRVPALLPAGWQKLTHRQIKRLVQKWRKTQHTWRFAEPGGYRDYILARMPEEAFAELYEEQKDGFWQTFRFGKRKPAGAEGSGTPRSAGPSEGVWAEVASEDEVLSDLGTGVWR